MEPNGPDCSINSCSDKSVANGSSSRRDIPALNLQPSFFIYFIFCGSFYFISSPFLYFKTCVIYFGGQRDNLESFCKSLGHESDIGNETVSHEANAIQAQTSFLVEYILIVSTVPAMIGSLIAGTWSDKHGRKPPLVLAIFATFLNAGTYTYSATFLESPTWPLLVSNFINGLTGGTFVIYQLVYAAARDTYPEPKAFSQQLGILAGLGYFGTVVGALLAGTLVDRYGYGYVFLIGLVATFVMFLHVVFVSKETLNQDNSSRRESIVNDQGEGSGCGVAEFCRSVGVTQAIRTMVKRREGRARFHVLLGLFAFFIMVVCDVGLSCQNIRLLYFKLPPLLWDDPLCMYYVAFTIGLAAVGTISVTWVLKHLGWPDSAVAIVGLTASGLLLAAICVSRTTLQIFSVSGLSFLCKLVYPGFNAHLAMLVPEAETGRLFALVSMVETLAPMVASFLFNNIYPLTLRRFPWFVFALGSGLIFTDALLMLFALFDTRKRSPFSTNKKSASSTDSERNTTTNKDT